VFVAYSGDYCHSDYFKAWHCCFGGGCGRQLYQKEDTAGNPWDFIIPVVTLIAITIWTEDILVGLIAGNAVCFLMYWPRRLMKFGEFFDNAMDGIGVAIPLIVICLVAVFARTGFEGLGIADYVIQIAASWMPARIFPLIVFLVVASLAFVTVSCWGIVSISIPILIPLSVAIGANPLLTVGAILSGSGFGSHACPYEDASVLTSQVTGISYMEHFTTQVPYAAISAGVASIAYLVMGFVL
jgi:Na+/H+ antiporter NhaC